MVVVYGHQRAGMHLMFSCSTRPSAVPKLSQSPALDVPHTVRYT